MRIRGIAAAAVAALVMVPAASAQITDRPQQDTVRAQQQDTARAGQQDTLRAGQPPAAEVEAQPLPGVQAGQEALPPQEDANRQNRAQQRQQRQGAMAMGAGGDMAVDSAFIVHAVSGNIKEVRLGELAQRNAENASVKQFGQRMVEAHRQAYRESRMIVDTMNLGDESVLDSMRSEDQETVDRFRSLQGEAFDSAYMRLMVEDHAKEIAEYRNQVQAGEEMMIRRYAVATLPVLRDHFELAQRTAREVGVQVQTPMAGEMDPSGNDTTAYMAPGRDSALAPADTSMMPRDVMEGQRDTTRVPGENTPRQAGTPDTPAVRPDTSGQARPDTSAARPRMPGDTTRPAQRDSMP